MDYTTTDLMRISGMTRMGVLVRVKKYRITAVRFMKRRTKGGNTVKEFLFSEAQAQAMGFLKPKEEIIEEIPGEDRIERMRRLHPLVTDDRCFNPDWWPDTEIEF